MVHRREINGEAVAFGNHGALWGRAMTWWDHDTGSVWSQPLGEAILGPLAGEALELLPSTLTRWSDWQALHPETLALDVATSPRGFALDQMSIVVELGAASASFPVPEIRRTGVVNAEIGGVPIAVVVQPGSDNWSVFSRQLDGRIVDLAVAGDELYEVGNSTGLRWEAARGLARDPAHADLALLPGFTSFQFDYWTFFPDGRVWDGQMLVGDSGDR